MASSSPFVALGTSSRSPLFVHSIHGGELSQLPTAILGGKRNDSTTSAVYGISRAPLSAPWGSSPQIIVSGWFDGIPVLSLYDPLSYDPIYSVSSGGGTSSHIAAGSARHSVVSFWDKDLVYSEPQKADHSCMIFVTVDTSATISLERTLTEKNPTPGSFLRYRRF
ncbi:hypothetical protein MPER_04167 [Moniliophthora perniciosa FA553]|nr:hypothetical protein MPER_04167 [Moniliophthora perniciosa FA553]